VYRVENQQLRIVLGKLVSFGKDMKDEECELSNNVKRELL
jgi:hypothetical protein